MPSIQGEERKERKKKEKKERKRKRKERKKERKKGEKKGEILMLQSCLVAREELKRGEEEEDKRNWISW